MKKTIEATIKFGGTYKKFNIPIYSLHPDAQAEVENFFSDEISIEDLLMAYLKKTHSFANLEDQIRTLSQKIDA